MNPKKYTIDRFEGNIAVLLLREDESVAVNVNRDQLPEEVTEGDILEITISKDGSISNSKILVEETQKAKQTAKALLDKLNRKHGDGSHASNEY